MPTTAYVVDADRPVIDVMDHEPPDRSRRRSGCRREAGFAAQD
jgi:hypothetical protein